MPIPLSRILRPKIDGPYSGDWDRQMRSADEILNRLSHQEGVILADQVGMGKTFTALAVAVSQLAASHLKEQVVILVPAKVATKWVNEWHKFAEMMVIDNPGIRCCRPAIRRGEDFLKALDDPPDRRNHLLVVTHEALTRKLDDPFIRLALIYYAIKNRRGVQELKAIVSRWSTGQSGLFPTAHFKEDQVRRLLDVSPSQWRKTWMDVSGDDLPDDPIPEHLESIVDSIDLEEIRSIVRALPKRTSRSIADRIKSARRSLDVATQSVWRQALVTVSPRLPLLIVDEAHALKNDHTKVSRLFTPRADDPEDGALSNIFDRMLFLTATPFELSHRELIRVISRFDAVRPDPRLPVMPLPARLEQLEDALERTHVASVQLDESWGNVHVDDLVYFDSWSPDADSPGQAPAPVRRAWRDAQLAVKTRQAMQQELRPWIIRHNRTQRREYLPGAAIGLDLDASPTRGIPVHDSAALAFLLAARVQQVSEKQIGGRGRTLFAYGIASSYETFQRLDGDHGAHQDSDDAIKDSPPTAGADGRPVGADTSWYHDRITNLLSQPGFKDEHPKISATADRAVDLWLQGHKTLIFCWYIRTTEALTKAIERGVNFQIHQRSARALNVAYEAGHDEVSSLARGLLRRGRRSHSHVETGIISEIRTGSQLDEAAARLVADIAIRNLRTPAFLIRFTHLSARLTGDDLLRGIRGDNPTGVNVLTRWVNFARRLSLMTYDERERVIASLLGHSGENSVESGFDDSPDTLADGRGSALATVRRAYGGTARQDRERLITVFNTPFAPEILVASSVMGEGIDLHQECRHVIHHDLDWNPSKLEQRTGRLDRIGALAEREGSLITVFEPYLSGTHDEKMYRVVKDRAGWFDIVMGAALPENEESTDKHEQRAPLPPAITDRLRIDLTVA